MITLIKKCILCLILFFNILHDSFAHSSPMEVLLPQLPIDEFISYHQCEKKFEYDVYLAGAHVGKFKRIIKWESNNNKISSEVNTSGKVNILWLDSTYKQTSAMIWLPQHNYFMTNSFTQKITGIRAREMDVVMSKNGLAATVELDNKINRYQNDNSPLYDIDTLGAQIRVNLLQGRKEFVLYRQATDQIKKYHFKVAGMETINHETWGDLNVIKIREVGEYSKMILWFSPKLDYQLVKAQLDAFISPLILLSQFSKQCPNRNNDTHNNLSKPQVSNAIFVIYSIKCEISIEYFTH